MPDRRPRSISTRWTFRYALAISVIVGAVSAYHYTQVVEKLERNAQVLLRLQANELLGRLQLGGGNVEVVESFIDNHAAMGWRVLRLGFRVFDEDGEIVVERGSFQEIAFPIPLRHQLPNDPYQSLITEADVGERFPFFLMAVAAPERGWVQVAIDTQMFGTAELEIRNAFLLSIPIVIMLTAGFGWVLAQGSLRPISEIAATARRIGASNLTTERVPRSGTGDELDRLAQTLNEMTDRISVGVKRMERFAGDAAHELRAPVARLRNRLETAHGAPRDHASDEKALADALADVDQLSEMVDAMLRLAHSGAGLDPDRVERVALGELIEDVVEFFSPLAEDDGVTLIARTATAVRVDGDPGWLRQMLANLLDNAIKFTREHGSVTVELSARDGIAQVAVRDTGCGIADDEQDRIFESFYRVEVQVAKSGVGIGLSLAREIARMHGGDISVESRSGEGSAFIVRLPRSGAPS